MDTQGEVAAPRDSEQTRVYWATLDIELAFPSIRLSRLRTAIAARLRNPPSVLELTVPDMIDLVADAGDVRAGQDAGADGHLISVRALMPRTRCFPGLLVDAARQCEGERAPALRGVAGSAPSCEAYER